MIHAASQTRFEFICASVLASACRLHPWPHAARGSAGVCMLARCELALPPACQVRRTLVSQLVTVALLDYC
jgi:hypothetical protein